MPTELLIFFASDSFAYFAINILENDDISLIIFSDIKLG